MCTYKSIKIESNIYGKLFRKLFKKYFFIFGGGVREVIIIKKLIVNSIVIICLLAFFVANLSFSYPINESEVDNIMIHEINDLQIFYDQGIINVYFGRKDCHLCNVLDTLIEKNDIELPRTLYYFDVLDWQEKGMSEMICQKFFITKVPTIIAIKNGEVIKEYDLGNYLKRRIIDE